MRSIGDKSAFGPGYRDGMTYRQWLIGQAIVGVLPIPDNESLEEAAHHAFRVADIIIDTLDTEKGHTK